MAQSPPLSFTGKTRAQPDRDGVDAVQVHMTNTSNLPVEALEVEYPLRVERYELIPNSGGAGKFRGGLGIRRIYRALADGTSFRSKGDRARFAPWGLAGGMAGGGGAFLVTTCRPDQRPPLAKTLTRTL